jgi:hypothetical protein
MNLMLRTRRLVASLRDALLSRVARALENLGTAPGCCCLG